MLKKKKYRMLILIAALIIGISGCGSSKEVVLDESYLIVDEPFVIPIHALKTHSKDHYEIREIIKKTYEAESKRQFDRIVKKYTIGDPAGQNRLDQFDESFFQNNKVYIVLSNYRSRSSGIVTGSEFSIEDDTLNVVVYEPLIPAWDIPKVYEGLIIAVNKEYVKDVKVININRK